MSNINWIDLRHRLEEAGVAGVLRLSQAQVLEAVRQLPADDTASAREAARTAGAADSPRVAAILALVAQGVWSDKQCITHLDDGSGVLIFRRDVGRFAHPVRAGTGPVDHWNIEVQRTDPQGRGPNKTVLNLHIILDKSGKVVDAYL